MDDQSNLRTETTDIPVIIEPVLMKALTPNAYV